MNKHVEQMAEVLSKVEAEIMQQPKGKTFADLSQEDIWNSMGVMEWDGKNWWHFADSSGYGPFATFELCAVDCVSKELRRSTEDEQ